MYTTIPYCYCIIKYNIIQYKYGRGDDNMDVYECKVCGKLFSGRKKKYCSKACSDEAMRIRNRDRWRKAHHYRDKDVNKICEWCGKSYEVKIRYASQSRFCSDKCQQTWYSRQKGYKSIEERNEERRKQKEIRQKRLEKERTVKRLKNSIQTIIKIKEEEERIKELTRNCAECGNLFYNPSPNVLTCSAECSRKRNRRISRMIYKGRINKKNLIDKDINLTKLYKKYDGICYLCGQQCDWNDKVVTHEGHIIVGGKYPSIEHVVPLSKGGMHSWDNVKLACMKCNALKGDKI